MLLRRGEDRVELGRLVEVVIAEPGLLFEFVPMNVAPRFVRGQTIYDDNLVSSRLDGKFLELAFDGSIFFMFPDFLDASKFKVASSYIGVLSNLFGYYGTLPIRGNLDGCDTLGV